MRKASFILLILAVCTGLMAIGSTDTEARGYVTSYRNNSGPYNLMAEVLNYNDVLLVWENPVFLNLPLGFRIYFDGCMVKFVAGTDVTDYLLENVCAGCHQMYVAAYFDSDSESQPSNIIEITITSNEDNILTNSQLGLLVYPNPSRGEVNIVLSGMKNYDATAIEIYNIKGQLIYKNVPTPFRRWLWDGRTIAGQRAGEGIYFVKASNSQGSMTKKLILVR